MRGKASLESRNIVTPKTSSVQIISPMPGSIRKPPLEASTRAPEGIACAIEPSIDSDDERGEQPGHEPVEEARLGQSEAEPLQLRDLVAHLGLAGDRLDCLAEDDADAHTGAHGAEATADSEADRLTGLGGFFGDGCQQGDESY